MRCCPRGDQGQRAGTARIFYFYDPPRHTVYRGLVSRVFTPKKMGALEAQIRQFCADTLDSLVGRERIDLIADYGAQVPMPAIGMLLGIPEAHQADVRDRAEDHIRTEPGKPRDFGTSMPTGESFADYVDWRVEHPSDDLMTDLLHAELEDETGTARRLTREEILSIVELISSAGNETTNRLIGWPEGALRPSRPASRARRQLVVGSQRHRGSPSLRAAPLSKTPDHRSGYRIYGEMLPAGGVILLLIGAANRDDRRFPDGDSFDIHRKVGNHLTFALRRPLLPRRGPGPDRGSGGARGAAQALPGLGGRPRALGTFVELLGTRAGNPACGPGLTRIDHTLSAPIDARPATTDPDPGQR